MAMKSKALDLIYSEIKERLDKQLESIDKLNTKAGVVIGFAGIILGATSSLSETPSNHFFILGNFLILISAFLSFLAFSPKAYRRDPDPEGLSEYLSKSAKDIKEQLIANFIDSFKENEKIVVRNSTNLKLAFFILFIGLVSFALSIL